MKRLLFVIFIFAFVLCKKDNYDILNNIKKLETDNKIELALKECRRLIENHPGNNDCQAYAAHLEKKHLMQKFNNQELSQEKLITNINKVKKTLRSIVAKDSLCQLAIEKLGILYLDLGELPQAAVSFNKVLKLDKNNLTANKNLGLIYFKLKEYNQSIEYLKKAFAIKPDDETVNEYLNGIYEELENIYLSQLEQNEEDLQIRMKLALLYIDIDFDDQAEEQFLEIISLSPDNIDAYNQLGHLKIRKWEFSDALFAFMTAESLSYIQKQ